MSFLAYLIWDPVHMYNAVTNNWQNFDHQITFDVRQQKTYRYTMERLRRFIADHPYVNVIRYTTFFHQFTLMFDELKEKEVQMAVNAIGSGRGVYISGLPYSFENSRVLYRAILWAAHGEESLHKWFSTNYNVEVHAFVANGKFCVVNNTHVPQDTVVYTDRSSFELHLEANEIRWYGI